MERLDDAACIAKMQEMELRQEASNLEAEEMLMELEYNSTENKENLLTAEELMEATDEMLQGHSENKDFTSSESVTVQEQAGTA